MKDYAPLNQLKPVAENIWIVDGPQIKLMKIPFSHTHDNHPTKIW